MMESLDVSFDDGKCPGLDTIEEAAKNALKFENLSFDCDYKEDKEMPKVQDQEASENEPLNLLRN